MTSIIEEKNETRSESAAVPAPAAEPNSAPAEKPKFRRKKRRWKWIVLAVVLVLAALIARSVSVSRSRAAAMQTDYLLAAAENRSVTATLSGSGALKPANSYTVISLVQGEVLAADFEEGDIVDKDTVLYEIDSSDVANNIERSQISLGQAQRGYANAADNCYIRSSINGQLFELKVKVGDEVSMGQQVAVLRDSAVMQLTVPFPADDAVNFYPGQAAEVILDGSFETLYGTVDTVSGSDIVGIGNSITRNVRITVSNPGGLSAAQSAAASIAGIGCSAPGVFTYNAESVVTASVPGTVVAVNTQEGSAVSKDQILVTLGGDDLNDSLQNAADSLRNAQLSMDSSQNQLDNYTITSPINGTIVDKQYKVGDNAETGRSLCIIYDLSYLEMTIYIDELDISKVAVGQSVAVTADAVEGKSYSGEITKVSIVGTTGAGGATSYPVTVRINSFDGLLPGMNADAEITVAKADNVLTIPAAALNRGNTVLITADSPSAVNALEQPAPEGYVYVSVKTGIGDDDYLEVLSGLQPGDTVAYQLDTAAASLFAMMYGMSGGMEPPQGGGMAPPQGGMGGGPGA
ncbi:MAG: HlyD family efflux transporter periplasmic adaptor subunit [Ruminococcaceae bacterium]|nr:HlyD family efflux transporter periplasmic adaptor subunit [Oscillospiraceae bacterium]